MGHQLPAAIVARIASSQIWQCGRSQSTYFPAISAIAAVDKKIFRTPANFGRDSGVSFASTAGGHKLLSACSVVTTTLPPTFFQGEGFLVIVMISDQLRQAVQQRAQVADNERQIGNIIYSALHDSGIAWQQIDRDGMKQLVVDAVRAFRNAQAGASASAGRGRADRAVASCCA